MIRGEKELRFCAKFYFGGSASQETNLRAVTRSGTGAGEGFANSLKGKAFSLLLQSGLAYLIRSTVIENAGT
jgi:hypothetical protein